MDTAMTPGGQEPPGIRFGGIDKFYGSFHVLKNIRLDIARGEHVVICGPSGSGKSTLIRCVNGLERHDAGQLTVNGIEMDGSRATTRRVRDQVGMCFQHFNLYPHLTALQNCTLAPVTMHRVARAEAEKTARAHLARVRMQDYADRYPADLSGGQQQRVAIARSLCLKPDIMLFDEPTSALDPETVADVLAVMQDLAAGGMTMVCVTHEMGFARSAADRMIFMDAGEIVEVAETATFFAQPAHARTRRFLDQVTRA